VITAHRRSMFFDMGYRDGAALDQMASAFRSWLQEKLASGDYLAWFAVASDGSVVAGLGLWLMDWPPHLIGNGSRRANILNVYTDPAHRRRGLARQLMDVALRWCRIHGPSTVILHSSNDGRPLYESLGFQPSNEMRLVLTEQ